MAASNREVGEMLRQLWERDGYDDAALAWERVGAVALQAIRSALSQGYFIAGDGLTLKASEADVVVKAVIERAAKGEA